MAWCLYQGVSLVEQKMRYALTLRIVVLRRYVKDWRGLNNVYSSIGATMSHLWFLDYQHLIPTFLKLIFSFDNFAHIPISIKILH